MSKALVDLKTKLLLEAIFQRYGDDFRGHRHDSVQAKLHRFMQVHGIATISSLQDRVLHDVNYIEALLRALDASDAELFGRPAHMRELRKTVLPWLGSCPAPRIWITDCSAAEDVYALVVLLIEENLYHKTHIFATNPNAMLLNEARAGKFALEKQARYEENYRRAGGMRSLSDYYREVEGQAVFNPDLGRNITWAQYNLGTDASFNEFELILCRGGLTDYASRLRRRTLQLFYDSLPRFGILSLDGANYSDVASFVSAYKVLSPTYGLYQRVI